MLPVVLSEKGQQLYETTYQTLVDRLVENGYAQTSLTGTYEGMFVRDASIQVMAHMAEGDVDKAERILRYMVAYHKALDVDFAVHIMNDLSEEMVYDWPAGEQPKLEANEQEWVLPGEWNDEYIVSAEFAVPASREGDTLSVKLYKGKTVVDEITHIIGADGKETERFCFCLPIKALSQTATYRLVATASRSGSVPCELRRVGTKKTIREISYHIQPDGHYMWVNAFAMFALLYGETYMDFVQTAYPFMANYSKYYVQNPEYMHENGLIRNPMYEHSRDARYWESYDLMTNVFVSEALHKMSLLADRLGEKTDASYFSEKADEFADNIHQHLVSEIDGMRFYTEMIAIDEDHRIVPGFSFVNFAPVASDWYAVDDELMENTYRLYRQYGNELYHGSYPMTVVCCYLDNENNLILQDDHVAGKGLAWELYHLWKNGDQERLQQMLDFIDENSFDTYPELWRRNGRINDSANQEQASWLVYEMARIAGKFSN